MAQCRGGQGADSCEEEDMSLGSLSSWCGRRSGSVVSSFMQVLQAQGPCSSCWLILEHVQVLKLGKGSKVEMQLPLTPPTLSVLALILTPVFVFSNCFFFHIVALKLSPAIR